MPSVNPEHEYVVAFVLSTQTAPAGEDVTTYPVTEVPPFEAGAVKVTVARPDALLEAETDVGASGTVAGTTPDEATDGSDVNRPLFAVALNV